MAVKLLNRKTILTALIFLVHITFSYYYFPWFYSALVGTIGILILAYFTWQDKYRYWTGLQIGRNQYLIVLIVFLILLGGSFVIVWFIAHEQNIRVIPGNYKNIVHTFFYTLNEEMVVGAILLKGIKHWSRKTPDWLISIGLAICFSVVHFIFFKWIFKNSGNLGMITLTSLFLAGIIRNNLILKTGHIGYSFSLHFAWIYVMLGSSHFSQTGKVFLNDFERFEIYLGDLRVLMVCLVLAGFSFLDLNKLLFTDKGHPVAKR